MRKMRQRKVKQLTWGFIAGMWENQDISPHTVVCRVPAFLLGWHCLTPAHLPSPCVIIRSTLRASATVKLLPYPSPEPHALLNSCASSTAVLLAAEGNSGSGGRHPWVWLLPVLLIGWAAHTVWSSAFFFLTVLWWFSGAMHVRDWICIKCSKNDKAFYIS